MFEIIGKLIGEFRRNPLPTVCALLVGSTVYLFLSLIEVTGKLHSLEERRGAEILEITRQCAHEIRQIKETEAARTDSVLRAELIKTQKQNHELEGLLKDLRKFRKQ